MKVTVFRPDRDSVRSSLLAMSSVECGYPGMGQTRQWPTESFPPVPTYDVTNGFFQQRRRFPIGSGTADYENAVHMLRTGASLNLDWVDCFQLRKFEEGDVFCLSTKAFGLWSSNFCRIVYLLEERTATQRMFSMGIGTLPVHAAVGEERMSVLWDRETDAVTYFLGSFSRAQTWLSQLFVVFLRRQQRRFASDSGHRLQDAIRSLNGSGHVLPIAQTRSTDQNRDTHPWSVAKTSLAAEDHSPDRNPS